MTFWPLQRPWVLAALDYRFFLNSSDASLCVMRWQSKLYFWSCFPSEGDLQLNGFASSFCSKCLSYKTSELDGSCDGLDWSQLVPVWSIEVSPTHPPALQLEHLLCPVWHVRMSWLDLKHLSFKEKRVGTTAHCRDGKREAQERVKDWPKVS